MKAMTANEMREVNGGISWGWISPWAKACAIARLLYEHQVYGRCYTRYGWMGVYCPICGKG